MTPARPPTPAPSEAGFALIEVVVSALIAVLVTGAVITLLNATGRAGAQERSRSQAFSIAQEDQTRLRSTRIADLNNALEPHSYTLNGTSYKVTSTAAYVSDQTGSTSCTSGSTADYVRIGSKVTWTGMGSAKPVVLESIVSPVSGSLDPTHGNLSVTVVNATQQKISGVGLSGTGPGSFSGSTDSNGCALFGGEPAGNYTLTPTLAAGYVTPNGDPPPAKSVSISAGTTTPILLEYDMAGTVKVGFTVKYPATGRVEASTADSIIAFNTGMATAHAFGTVGTPVSTIEAASLFPFTSPDSFYAGACTTNKPTAGGASVSVPAGGSAVATVQLPALYLTVKNSAGAAISGARVTVTDRECKVGSTFVKRIYTTNSSGGLTDPGLPWGKYDICASASISGTQRFVKATNVAVENLEGSPLSMTVPSSGSAEACP